MYIPITSPVNSLLTLRHRYTYMIHQLVVTKHFKEKKIKLHYTICYHMIPLQLTQLDLLLVALSSSTIKDNINISIIKTDENF